MSEKPMSEKTDKQSAVCPECGKKVRTSMRKNWPTQFVYHKGPGIIRCKMSNQQVPRKDSDL